VIWITPLLEVRSDNSIASTAFWIYDARNIRLFCIRESSTSQIVACLL